MEVPRWSFAIVATLVLGQIAVYCARSEDYVIIDVTTECGGNTTDTATVNVVLDSVNIVPLLKCDGDHTFPLTTTDDIHYSGTADYSGDPTTGCVFKTTGISIYELNVIVGMVGASGVWVRTQEGPYEVICNFGDSQAPRNVEVRNLGANISSSLTLEVTDVTRTA